VTTLEGVAWFIQISDTHVSSFDQLPDRQKLHGDKAGDLEYDFIPVHRFFV
jgi:hypothetical protein